MRTHICLNEKGVDMPGKHYNEDGSVLIELVLATIAGLIVLSGIFAAGLHQIDIERVSRYGQELNIIIDRAKALKRTSSTNATNNNYILLTNAFLIANADLPTGMINGNAIENNLNGNVTITSGAPLLNVFYVNQVVSQKYCVDAVLTSWKSSGANELLVNGVSVALDSNAQPQINMATLLAQCVGATDTLRYKIQW